MAKLLIVFSVLLTTLLMGCTNSPKHFALVGIEDHRVNALELQEGGNAIVLLKTGGVHPKNWEFAPGNKLLLKNPDGKPFGIYTFSSKKRVYVLSQAY